MNYAVLYSSVTGNTRAAAEAIYRALPGGQARLEAIGPATAPPAEETVFLGFWTDKGRCPEDFRALAARLHGKRVALFGTAGFGGSEEYFQVIEGRAADLLPPGNRLLASWMCQGRMPPEVRARYEAMALEKPNDPQILSFLSNYDAALAHPDARDLRHAADFALRVAAMD